MPSLQCERSAILLCGLGLALANALSAQSVGKDGEEYSLSGARAGDQTAAQIAIGPAGGFVVWQDNAIDGPGRSFGIAARRLNADLQPSSGVFRVNKILNAPQQNPQVALLKSGAASFVWQGGKLGAQDIYLRTLTARGVWMPATTDLRVNGFTAGQQSAPLVSPLVNGNLAIVWCSLHQDRSLEGVYGRIVKPTGVFVTSMFRVNQFTGNNQRSPALTTLANGDFVVAWVSENQDASMMEVLRHTNRVHVYARVFAPNGVARGNEFRINTRSNICSAPSVAAWGDRGFTVTWAEKTGNSAEGWDIYARTFSALDAPATDAVRVNDTTEGDQVAPRIASVSSDELVVWRELYGSREIFGRFLRDGQVNGSEFRVNTYTNGAQTHATVAANKTNEFLVGWSSFMLDTSFDIQGQRYSVSQPPAQDPVDSGGSGAIMEIAKPPATPPTIGLTNFAVITSSPANSSGVRVSIGKTSKGNVLSWNTEAGKTYQVQYSTNCAQWQNLGDPRPAAGASDITVVGNSQKAAFYRVIRVP